jgi:uncharacterized protein
MKLGIMSDSHGRVNQVHRALELLEDAGAEAIVHCGDLGGLEVLEALAGRPCWFVWGNTDHPDASWRDYVTELGLPFPDGPVHFLCDGKSIAVFHGHEKNFAKAITAAEHDYLVHGHTHRRNDQRIQNMRIINPRALHRSVTRTVALLDLKTDELEFIEVK